MKKRKQKTIPFVNNKGEKIHLPANVSIADLFKMGMTKLEIVPKDYPLRKGWWKNV